MLELVRSPVGLDVIDTSTARRILRYSTDPRFRTHIHPLNVPGTEYALTRFRPVDHPWQYGIFVGLNKVNGYDFWCCGDANYPAEVRGQMRFRELARADADESGVSIEAVSDWLKPDGAPLLEERQGVAIATQPTETSYAFDFNWSLTATVEDITIDHSDYGGFSARLVGTPQARRHVKSEGQEADDCADQPARWCTVSQTVDGVGIYSREARGTFAYAGVAIFDHPDNPRTPNKWRVDGQGMINPAMALSGPFEIAKGDTLALRYRVYVFLGTGEPEQIEAAYKDWTENS